MPPLNTMNNHDMMDETADFRFVPHPKPHPQIHRQEPVSLALHTARGLKVSELTDAELLERCEHASAKDWVVIGPELQKRLKRYV